MIDRKALRTDASAMEEALKKRGEDVVATGSTWKKSLTLDAQQRQLKSESEKLQAERNKVCKIIGLKKKNGEDASAELQSMGEVGK